MKLNEKMRYPYPVMSKHSRDYTNGEFSAEFFHQQTSDNEIMISSTLRIDNQELKALVTEQKAASGYFLVCRPTYYNYLQEAPLGISEKYFDLSLLHGRVTIRPVVWTLIDIIGFKSPSVNKEFGEDIRIRKGSIIAMGPEFRFSVDPRRFRPFETIFNLSVDENVPPGMIEVDPEQDKIGILAEKGTHASIADMRNLDVSRSVMLSSVYMPVITDIVAQIQSNGNNLESRRWYQVFEAKCDDLGIQPKDRSVSPLKIAQQLLKAPLEVTIKVLEKA